MRQVARRQFLIAAGALLAASGAVHGQQTKKQYRIGYLTTGDPPRPLIYKGHSFEDCASLAGSKART